MIVSESEEENAQRVFVWLQMNDEREWRKERRRQNVFISIISSRIFFLLFLLLLSIIHKLCLLLFFSFFRCHRSLSFNFFLPSFVSIPNEEKFSVPVFTVLYSVTSIFRRRRILRWHFIRFAFVPRFLDNFLCPILGANRCFAMSEYQSGFHELMTEIHSNDTN